MSVTYTVSTSKPTESSQLARQNDKENSLGVRSPCLFLHPNRKISQCQVPHNPDLCPKVLRKGSSNLHLSSYTSSKKLLRMFPCSSPMLIYLTWEMSEAWQIDPIKEHFTLWHSEAIKMCTSGAGGRNMQTLLYPVHCHAIYGPWSSLYATVLDIWKIQSSHSTAQNKPKCSLVLLFPHQIFGSLKPVVLVWYIHRVYKIFHYILPQVWDALLIT